MFMNIVIPEAFPCLLTMAFVLQKPWPHKCSLLPPGPQKHVADAEETLTHMIDGFVFPHLVPG